MRDVLLQKHNPLRDYEEKLEIMENFNHPNQRADKFVVEIEGGTKRATYYTMTCPDCGGVGRYDERGDVVCEDCGVLIAGPESPMSMPVDTTDTRGYATETYYSRHKRRKTHRGSDEPLI